MAESGYGHVGRIPNYGVRGQQDARVMAEPPACIQNAMMTKDKKPFTYTPGGLDLSQIRTPSMARRLARQRSQEEAEQAYAQQQAMANGGQQPSRGGGSGPPPPPPFQAGPPPPPPPPPLVIQTPSGVAAKPETVIRPIGERPEIVIPENPIGMLRKTNSPYHWEQEQAEKERLGAVPKFVEKAPSPVMQQNPPMAFSQQPPSTYTPQIQNNPVRYNHSYGGSAVNQSPESPLHKPEPQYPVKPSIPSPTANIPTPTRDYLQRQDSQFNKSPTPFGPQSTNSPQAVTNGSPISPSPNSSWRQPERRDSPLANASTQQRSPFSPTNVNRSPQFSPQTNNQSPSYQNQNQSPPVYHTLPRASPRVQDNYTNNLTQSPPRNVFNNTIYNNVRDDPRSESPKVEPNNPTPWRTATLSRNQRDIDNNNYAQAPNQNFNNPPFYRPNELPAQQNVQQNPWTQNQQNDQNQWTTHKQQKEQSPPVMLSQLPGEVRYQTHMSIPVTPKKQQQSSEQETKYMPPKVQTPPQPQPNTNREVVFVTQEPVYYHNPESPKSVPPWAKSQKQKTPPPEWCQRPLDGRKSLTRELVSPPKEKQVEPEWVQKSNEMRSAARELTSPPRTHQGEQPTWSTKPSENRKSVPRDSQPVFNHGPAQNGQGNRVIPIQIESNQKRGGDQHPQLRIIIDMQNPQGQPQGQPQAQPPYSQPTQRIMRVLSPQLVRLDQQEVPSQQDLPSLSSNQPRTRIIPIQLESGGSEATNRRTYYHQFTCEGPPRQSKAFRVLQSITGTMDADIQGIEDQHGFSDL